MKADLTEARLGSAARLSDVLLRVPRWKAAYIMVVLWLLYFLDAVARYIMGPLLPSIQQELGLSDSELGMLGSVVLAMVCVLVLPLSYVVDRWRRGRLVSLMSIAWSAASVASGLSQGFGQLLASRAALGVGEASFVPAGVALISSMFDRTRRTLMIGLWDTAFPLGLAGGMMLGGVLAATVGWRATLIVVGVPGIILGILAWFLPDYVSRPRAVSSEMGGAKDTPLAAAAYILGNRTLLSLFVAYGLGSVMQQSMVYWLPTFFNRFMGIDVVQAGLIGGTVFLTALVSTPLGGWITDRWSMREPRAKVYLCFAATFLGAVAAISAIYTQNLVLFYVGAFLALLCFPSVQVISQEVVPTYHRSLSYGALLVAQYVLGGLWGPVLTGALSEVTNLQVALIATIFISVMASFIYLCGVGSYTRDYERARKSEEAAGVTA